MRQAILFALGVVCVACPSQEREHRRSEVHRIAHAVGGIRDAANVDKGRLLGALRRESCSFDAGCRLLTTCRDAYELQVAAIDRVEAVRRQIGAASAEQHPRLLSLLEQSERDLRQGRAGALECSAAEADLKREYPE